MLLRGGGTSWTGEGAGWVLDFFHQEVFDLIDPLGVFLLLSRDITEPVGDNGPERTEALSSSSAWELEFNETRDRNRRIEVGCPGD